MADGNGLKSSNKNEKTKQKNKLDFDSMYEQLQKDHPILITNKNFWARKGNSQKYTCSLCNISIHVSSNLNALKSELLTHVTNKYHKKRYETHLSEEINSKSTTSEPNEISKNPLIDEQTIPKINKHVDNEKTNERKDRYNTGEQLVDFDTVYDTFEKDNPVIKTSKQFIIKEDNSRHYVCTLCKTLIFFSLSANEFRYSLWVHLNEESHRERLPNFLEVQDAFNYVMRDLSKVSNKCEDDLEYFEIGPVFRFVKCSLCDIAVSVNLHRLENHILGEDHIQRKEMALKGDIKKESISDCTRNQFRKLVVKLDDKFKKEIRYIHIGKIPGYVVCSLCTYVILPTQFYVQTHFESKAHINHKKKSPVNKQSKFRAHLKDLFDILPDDVKDYYTLFKEDICGLTCSRCKESVPATSIDLYSHIMKERLNFVR